MNREIRSRLWWAGVLFIIALWGASGGGVSDIAWTGVVFLLAARVGASIGVAAERAAARQAAGQEQT